MVNVVAFKEQISIEFATITLFSLTEGRPPGQRPSLRHAASRQKKRSIGGKLVPSFVGGPVSGGKLVPLLKLRFSLKICWSLLLSVIFWLEEKLVSFLAILQVCCLVWKRSWSLSLLFGKFC